jgi:hypothetical protein
VTFDYFGRAAGPLGKWLGKVVRTLRVPVSPKRFPTFVPSLGVDLYEFPTEMNISGRRFAVCLFLGSRPYLEQPVSNRIHLLLTTLVLYSLGAAGLSPYIFLSYHWTCILSSLWLSSLFPVFSK